MNLWIDTSAECLGHRCKHECPLECIQEVDLSDELSGDFDDEKNINDTIPYAGVSAVRNKTNHLRYFKLTEEMPSRASENNLEDETDVTGGKFSSPSLGKKSTSSFRKMLPKLPMWKKRPNQSKGVIEEEGELYEV